MIAKAADADVAVCRLVVRPRHGRPLRRGLPLVVPQKPLAGKSTCLVRLEPAEAGGRLHPGDGYGVDARRPRVRSRGCPVTVRGKVVWILRAIAVVSRYPELRRPAGREIGQRRLARLHELHERDVRGRNLPHARLVRVDADVADLHRIGRARERPGPGRHRRSEADGRTANDHISAKSLHGYGESASGGGGSF